MLVGTVLLEFTGNLCHNAHAMGDITKFSEENRKGLAQRLKTQEFDLVIIGGGITGASILRDAAYRGLKAALVEMGDFASGTSSKSSKLIHGGLRYLETLDFGLVFESVNERTRLLKLARHIVKPLSFVFPVYKDDKNGLFKLKAGLWLYDMLCAFRNRNHKGLSKTGVAQWVPGIRRQDLRGGVQYYDAITDDARLNVEVILDAYKHNGVPLNYVQAGRIQTDNGNVVGLSVKDLLSQEEFEVKTRFVVFAAGPWTSKVMELAGVPDSLASKVKMRPTKGTHIVIPYERLPLDNAVVMLHPDDHRVMFALPWHNRTVLGTTDTDYKGDPTDVVTTVQDVDYLLTAANHYFPDAGLKHEDIVSNWSGLRPLVDQDDAKKESEVSREHTIAVDPTGIGAIAGGKLTTFRIMGKQMVDAIIPYLGKDDIPGSKLKNTPLPYANGTPEPEKLIEMAATTARDYGIQQDQAIHLLSVYGGVVDKVLDLAKDDKLLLQPVVKGLPILMVEALFSVKYEMAIRLEDFFLRRTPLFFLVQKDLDLAFERVAAVMGKSLGWTDENTVAEIKNMEKLSALHNQWLRGNNPDRVP